MSQENRQILWALGLTAAGIAVLQAQGFQWGRLAPTSRPWPGSPSGRGFRMLLGEMAYDVCKSVLEPLCRVEHPEHTIMPKGQ